MVQDVDRMVWEMIKGIHNTPDQDHIMVEPAQDILLGGVGHCFAWHVQVGLDFNFNFNFKTEELVHSGLCAM